MTTGADSNAVEDPFVPDEELAKKPVIVVAKWDKAVMEEHHEFEGEAIKNWEMRTGLVIERVIQGKIKPGKQKILLKPFVSWGRNGGKIYFTFPLHIMFVGDVKDVTRSNLWFLSFKRSWDKKDPNVYLSLDTHLGVQPASLEPYFRALQAEDPRTTVPPLLASEDPEVVLRSLRFICGGVVPWPYDPDDFLGSDEHKDRRAVWREQSNAVAKLLTRKDAAIRRRAACVYAELAGKESIPTMTKLLVDPDGQIRAIAIGILVQRNAIVTDDAIAKAAERIDDGYSDCRVIDALRKHNNDQAVPGLISFLQNDNHNTGLGFGDYDGIPALRAQIALKELTGHWFPLDVRASQEVWEKAKQLPDAGRSKDYLSKNLPNDPAPVKAALVHEKAGVFVVLTNTSKKEVTLAEKPSEIHVTTDHSLYTGPYEGGAKKEGFLKLAPGEFTRLPLDKDKYHIGVDLKSVKVRLRYTRNGNKFGINSWMGTIVAGSGPD